MLFNLALFTSLLVAPVVLAFHPDFGARIAHRSEGIRSRVGNRLGLVADSVLSTQYTHNWAGAVLTKDNGTFTIVTGTITVPVLSGATGASAAAWVGIDGDTCQTAILQTGIVFTAEDGPPAVYAWYEWYPEPSYNFSGITISAGDVIRLTVLASSATSGTATIENLTNGQTVTQNLNSSDPLCRQDGEWIVEDYQDDNGDLVPLANFSNVTFKDAVATGPGNETYTPDNATTIFDIRQNNTVLTNVSTSGDSVTIQYV